MFENFVFINELQSLVCSFNFYIALTYSKREDMHFHVVHITAVKQEPSIHTCVEFSLNARTVNHCVLNFMVMKEILQHSRQEIIS